MDTITTLSPLPSLPLKIRKKKIEKKKIESVRSLDCRTACNFCVGQKCGSGQTKVLERESKQSLRLGTDKNNTFYLFLSPHTPHWRVGSRAFRKDLMRVP